MTHEPFGRRSFLRGAGAAVALPFLHSLLPRAAWAADPVPPLRLCWVFVPNGMHMQTWTPTIGGAEYELPWTLAPLERRRADLLVLSGLTISGGWAHGDGPGDHARSASSFLTCAHPKKTGGVGIRAGESVDQVAARHLGAATRFPSLELGTERGARSGECDSGYSCVYSSAVSWRTPTSPNAKETRPRLVFDRLFMDGREGDSAADTERRLRRRRSVLDFVMDDAKTVRGGLGTTDARKLDEYLTGLRELERRLQMIETARERGTDTTAAARPDGTPTTFSDHQRLMYDLIALAFQADVTRVATFMVGNAGSNRTFGEVGVRDAWHGLSHHGGDAAKNERIRKIDRFNVEQFAHFLDRLAAIDDPVADGKSLLDGSLVVYGSGIGDGNKHNHNNLPFLLAGHGHGAAAPGRHVKHARDTPAANLYRSMLLAAGCPDEPFADATTALRLR